ncbi:siderophore-interacting protein [Pokkaliibacter sp. MBI-7]|uniref:siderophore-interacting protein n=1 Tax=Pokkaliibacter sp. MBI-7 TaxID=3040600 RepID=UPI00244873B5|nr:siderophore-interacting protein [Pokkaliibacter sp. MBI-7]MDH2433795.1 siderophore-interacting protein [Pokkaliibacter sp. MBI-7]
MTSQTAVSQTAAVQADTPASADVPQNLYRPLTVLRSEVLSPEMLRLTLQGEDLSPFDTLDNLHVRFYVPVDLSLPCQWPGTDAEGRPQMGSPSVKNVTMRYYTIRRIDVARGEVDIDFVTHGHAGPASNFARAARPGDRCAMSGPCGFSVKAADWYLLAGDETALPAIARLLDSLPHHCHGSVHIEVSRPGCEVVMPSHPGLPVHWYYRMEQGQSDLPQALAGVPFAAIPEQGFIWVAGEYELLRRCQAAALADRLWPKERLLGVPYWRRKADN